MPSMKLYYASGACSFVPHTLLEAAGADFEPVQVKLHRDEQHSPEYLAINPDGQVPVLVDGDAVITQIVAIVDHLDRRFAAAGFLPTEPLARTRALSVLAWMNNTVHPTFTHIFMPQKFTDKPELHADLKAFNRVRYEGCLDALQSLVLQAQAAHGAGAWLSGASFGPLDSYALTLTRWGSMVGIDPCKRSTLWAFIEKRVAAHPPVAAVLERERVPLNLYKPA